MEDADALRQRVRELCARLPQVFEKLAWGDASWRAGEKGKLFAMFDNHHHGAPDIAVWVMAPEGAQAMYVEANPARFFIPPYQGRAGWIAVRLEQDTDWDELATILEEGYRAIASKKLLAELEAIR